MHSMASLQTMYMDQNVLRKRRESILVLNFSQVLLNKKSIVDYKKVKIKLETSYNTDETIIRCKWKNIFQGKKIILWKRCGFLPHPLYKTPIVKASSWHIWLEFLQGIRQFGIFTIHEKSISKHTLSLNPTQTICRQSEWN